MLFLIVIIFTQVGEYMDLRILEFIRDNIRADWLDPIMKFFTTIGDMGIFVLTSGIVLLFFKQYRRIGLMIIITAAIGFIINDFILKNVIGSVRPCQVDSEFIHYTVKCPTSYSMPSGHTLQGLFPGIILLYHKKFKVGLPLLVVGLIIAFTRMYFAVHWPSDILVGALMSLMISFCVYSIFQLNPKLAKIWVNK